jgi:uncharacterized protein YbjT (DUF2867 family)
LSGLGLPLRLLVRDRAKAAVLETDLIQTAEGDVRSPAALERAMSGVTTVISAISAFGRGAGSTRTVDWEGNRNLIRVAEAAGVEHFILISVHGAALDHPIELFRMKYLAEQLLTASTLSWTILRPTANFETWANLLGEPLLETGKTMVFGRGENPINFVSVRDVARFVQLAVVDPTLRGSDAGPTDPYGLPDGHHRRDVRPVGDRSPLPDAPSDSLGGGSGPGLSERCQGGRVAAVCAAHRYHSSSS